MGIGGGRQGGAERGGAVKQHTRQRADDALVKALKQVADRQMRSGHARRWQ